MEGSSQWGAGPDLNPGLLGPRLPGCLSWLRILLQCRRPQFDSWVRKIRWRRDRLPTQVFLGFPGGSAGKASACNAGDLGLNPGLGRSTEKGKGYPLQYSDLENSMDYSPWGCEESDTTEQLNWTAWPQGSCSLHDSDLPYSSIHHTA